MNGISAHAMPFFTDMAHVNTQELHYVLLKALEGQIS